MAALHAEITEKEKHIVEVQGNINSMKAQLQALANRQVALEREKKRCQITRIELATLQPEHKVFKGIGRLFASIPVNQLEADMKDKEEKCGNEATRLGEEKIRLGTVLQGEEERGRVLVTEFMSLMRAAQSLNGGNSGAKAAQ